MSQRRARRTGAAVAAGAAMGVLALTGVLAAPADAHSGVWSVTCDAVSVHLKDYDKKATNSVTLQVVGGEGVLAFDPDFGSSFTYDDALPAHDSPLPLHLVVKAGDGPKHDIDEVKTSPPCDKPTTTPPTTTTPPPTTTPPAGTTPATTTPATTAPATTPATTPPATTPATSAPAAGTTSPPSGADLADTGSSDATPVIAGIAAAAVVAGAGAVAFARKRRSSSSSHR